ncbi:putative disease resistance RPP13-like protein 1 [Quercus lobata]|uniref:putative disease resistance RPP13-like protein 1 n=1 Tax=Quercus lobata TaxID=97700 RepID=UPI0012449C6B|nr:putative disease resistance RPP13-like protein 1 [Quercus lobata]
MGRKRDRFWDYAEDLKGRFKCNYCKREFPGGASRIKSHLAGVKGCDILICGFVPEDVQKEAYEATQGTNKKLKNASISSSDKGSTIPSTSISTIQKEKIVTQSEEEYIDEIVLDDVVGRLVTKAFSLATNDIIFKWGFKEELENLFYSLYKIKVVLYQKRQVSDEFVRIWLMELRNVAYEVDNVLDKFDYEIIRQKVQPQSQMIDQVCSFSFYDHNKVKTIKQSLDKLVADVAGFGLRIELLKSIIKIRLDKNEDSFLNDSEVIGREFDVVKIVNELISSSNQQVISVLPIVGMVGLGKTTLAKVLYNHGEIKKHFDVLAWVHVGGNFDVEEISRKIHESLKIDLTNLEKKKYFLVLDDIWIEDCDKWDILRNHLVGINSNTRINIIVTTRSDKVAQIMGTLPPHHLEKLSKGDCWSILKERVFADEGKSLTFDLEASGREIAIKCRGVPLVARVLGEAMYFKCDKSEWLAIQNDKIWHLLYDDNAGIFPTLKLWFDNLPIPSLKQCFAYCAIFPKDYDMKKDKIIRYWMAEGFLEPVEEANMAMEDIGNMYFNILLTTSFFQNARKDAYGNIISCKMHDLVHDFALSISKHGTLILDRDSTDEATQESSYHREDFIKLHSLFSENFDFNNMLSNFKCLRVLKLHGVSIRGFPDSIEPIIHLRLLHILDPEIEELPKSITKLYNLQTLIIEGYERELPEDLSNLIKLRHILLNSSEIINTPKNMSMLTCLQTLSFFAVDSEDGYRITELGALKNLKGEIVIKNLKKVKDEEEAKSAKLKEKEISNLGLYWKEDEEDDMYDREEDMYDKDEKVLEGLQPHPNLKRLTIFGYGGKKFPSWVGLSSLYHNLIEITLYECSNCEEVPTLGQLPCLRVLEMEEMGEVRCIGSEFYFYSDGSYRNTTTLFPALRILKLVEMETLVEWKDAKELTTADEVLFVFPCLEELTTADSLCTCVSFQKLVVEGCRELRSLPGVRSIIRSGIEDPPSGLQYLENGDCRRLPSSSTSSIHPSQRVVGLSSLYHNLIEIDLRFCNECEEVPTLGQLPCLRVLEIIGMGKVRCIGSEFYFYSDGSYRNTTTILFPALRILKLESLRELEEWKDAKELTTADEVLFVFPCLQELTLRSCYKLRDLPDSLRVSLQKLVVWHCPELRSLPGVRSSGLQYLENGDCRRLPSSSTSSIHPSLQKLKLSRCRDLPLDQIQYFIALKILWIESFQAIESLPDELGNLSSLQKLYIVDCLKLVHLPTGEAMRCLTQLKMLEIYRCPNLEDNERIKISHVPLVKIINDRWPYCSDFYG